MQLLYLYIKVIYFTQALNVTVNVTLNKEISRDAFILPKLTRRCFILNWFSRKKMFIMGPDVDEWAMPFCTVSTNHLIYIFLIFVKSRK